MNYIIAVLENIISVENLNLLHFKCNNQRINVLILQLNLNLKKNKKAKLYIKPTKLFLNKDKYNYENRLKVKIEEINFGEILARIKCKFFEYDFEVLMLKEYINFKDEAYLYFKSTDISVVEVLDD